MLSGQVWPAHPQPQEDELLTSWLIRSARANATKLHTFTQITAPGHDVWNRDIDKSASDDLLEAMTHKTGLTLGTLRGLTLRSYEGRLYRKLNTNGNCAWLLSLGVYHRERKRHGLQVCPKCLAESVPYYRKRWRLGFVTVCSKHRIRLLDACPKCKRPIVFHRRDFGNDKVMPSTKPITLCFNCGYDLRRSRRRKLADEDVLAFQEKLLRTLSSSYATLPEHGKIESVAYFDGVRQLLTVLMGLRHAGPFASYVAERVGVCTSDYDLNDTSNDLEYQPLVNRHRLMKMAVWLFEDWPKRFIRAYAQVGMAPSYVLADVDDVPAWLEDTVNEAHEARLRFEKEHKPPNPYGDLTGQDKACLQDLLEHGADFVEIVRARVVDLEYLLSQRYLTTLDSPLGTLVSVGSRGRKALGVYDHSSLIPNTAAGQVMRRRVREKLEAQGWTYLKKEGRFLISLRSPEGKKRYLLCGYGKYSSRTVRRNFSKLGERLVEEDALLMVVSGKPEKLMGIEVVKEGWVEVIDANIAGNFYQK